MSALTGRERFLRAANREPVDGPPLWLMRQAGRYLPEYHTIRSKGSFMETVADPERAAEVTCQPLRRYDLDAAIIFCDILVPAAAMGMDVEVLPGKGPQLGPPVRTMADVDRLEPFDPEEKTAYLGEALRKVRAEIGEERALIGFCGAPFTQASYMIEGASTRNFVETKKLLYGEPRLFSELIEKTVDSLVPYLGFQVDAGVDALQIFDSWGGQLDARTYERVLGPPMERLISAAQALDVPVIVYVNGGGHLLELLADLGARVLGIDWRTDPRDARKRVGDRCALQGNLDPVVLSAPDEAVAREVDAVLDAFGPEPGHLFNVGSGLLPTTRPEAVQVVVERVKARRGRAG